MEDKEIKNEFLRFINDTFFKRTKIEFFVCLSLISIWSFYSVKNIEAGSIGCFIPNNQFLAFLWQSISEEKYIYIVVLLIIATGMARVLAILNVIPLVSSIIYRFIGQYFKEKSLKMENANSLLTNQKEGIYLNIDNKFFKQNIELFKAIYFSKTEQLCILDLIVFDPSSGVAVESVQVLLTPYGYFIINIFNNAMLYAGSERWRDDIQDRECVTKLFSYNKIVFRCDDFQGDDLKHFIELTASLFRYILDNLMEKEKYKQKLCQFLNDIIQYITEKTTTNHESDVVLTVMKVNYKKDFKHIFLNERLQEVSRPYAINEFLSSINKIKNKTL